MHSLSKLKVSELQKEILVSWNLPKNSSALVFEKWSNRKNEATIWAALFYTN